MSESVPLGGDILAESSQAASVLLAKAARRDEASESESRCGALPVSASRVQVKALSRAVGEVLTCFGLGEVACAEVPGTTDASATMCDLTVVDRLSPTGRGDLHGALVFGFEPTVARAFAARIADFMFDEPVEAVADEGSDLFRLTLSEMASFTVLATLSSLGLPPEPPAPRLVAGKGTKLWPAPRVARSLRVTTDLGAFEVVFAPGAPLGGAPGLPGSLPAAAGLRPAPFPGARGPDCPPGDAAPGARAPAPT